MRKILTIFARFIASIFALLFVITTILSLVLLTLNHQLFNAKTYKNALADQNIYERLPEMIGSSVTSLNSFLANPCSENPLACDIDRASPELQACLTNGLGADAYQAIGSSQRKPTEAELQLAQPCLDQYATPQTGESQSGTGGSGGMPSFFQNLSAADYQVIITILLPPGDLQTMVEGTIDQLFAYLNGEADTATISLILLKDRLAGPAGTDIITQLINAQPACTEQELAQINSGINEGPIICLPPENTFPTLVTQLQEQLNSAITEIPDQAVLIKPPAAGSPTPGSGPFGADPLASIRWLRLIIRLSPLLPLTLLLFVTLFAVRSIKSWLRWWGIPLLFSGVIAFSLGILILPAFGAAWTLFVVPKFPSFLPPDIASLGQELVRSIAQTLSAGIVIGAVILIALGLAAWIGSYFIKTKTIQNMPVTPTTPTP